MPWFDHSDVEAVAMKLLLIPITHTDITHTHRDLSHPEVIRYYVMRFMTLGATQEQME
jgi:hypothetical protein